MPTCLMSNNYEMENTTGLGFFLIDSWDLSHGFIFLSFGETLVGQLVFKFSKHKIKSCAVNWDQCYRTACTE